VKRGRGIGNLEYLISDSLPANPANPVILSDSFKCNGVIDSRQYSVKEMTMTTVQLDLDFDQIKRLVDRLPRRDKAELARFLDDQTLFAEMRRVRKELKSLPITQAELDAEVNAAKKA
jgi:hypothetical protein